MTLRRKKRQRRVADPDARRGLYRKYEVMRTDGSTGRGGRHEHCRHFVLDLTHDPHARYAALMYAEAIVDTNPILAADLKRSVDEAEREDDYKRPRKINGCSTFLMGVG